MQLAAAEASLYTGELIDRDMLLDDVLGTRGGVTEGNEVGPDFRVRVSVVLGGSLCSILRYGCQRAFQAGIKVLELRLACELELVPV